MPVRLPRIQGLPGVESAGLTTALPPGAGPGLSFRVIGGEGPGGGSGMARFHEVSPGFFETHGDPDTPGPRV
jgi:hypothetical protein